MRLSEVTALDTQTSTTHTWRIVHREREIPQFISWLPSGKLPGAKGIATRSKDATFGAPGLTTRSKKLLVTNAHLSSISTSCFCLARVFGVKEGWFGLVSSWATQDVSSQRVMDAGRVTFAAHSHLLAPQMQRSPGRCGCSLRHGPAKCSGTAKSLGKAC